MAGFAIIASVLAIFLTAGYPDYKRSIKALRILNEKKVKYIELGVPFADPLADGPVIQNASFQALKQGMNLDKVFELLLEAREGQKLEDGIGLANIVLFSYYNALFAYGFERVLAKCQQLNIKSILIPDLPVEEAADLHEKFTVAGVQLTLLAAITSPRERLVKIAKYSKPFVYLVGRIGTTGSQQDIENLQNKEAEKIDADKLVSEKISELRELGVTSVGLGFGIDSAEKVKAAYKQGADIAIIGSKAIQVLEQDSNEDLLGFEGFIESLKVS